jgi:hypothetical protein
VNNFLPVDRQELALWVALEGDEEEPRVDLARARFRRHGDDSEAMDEHVWVQSIWRPLCGASMRRSEPGEPLRSWAALSGTGGHLIGVPEHMLGELVDRGTSEWASLRIPMKGLVPVFDLEDNLVACLDFPLNRSGGPSNASEKIADRNAEGTGKSHVGIQLPSDLAVFQSSDAALRHRCSVAEIGARELGAQPLE